MGKKILFYIISGFSVIVMILIKIMTALLILPLKLFKWLLKVAMNLLTFICWIVAAIVAVFWIRGFFSGSNLSIDEHIVRIFSFLVLAVAPILFKSILLFIDWLEEIFYIIWKLPVTLLILIFSNQKLVEKLVEKPVEMPVEMPVEKDNNYFKNGLKNKSMKGELMRSKSEVLIANMLYGANIDYIYEKPLMLPGEEKMKSPDFTIISKDTETTIFWEHCGMMSIYSYRKRWEEKRTLYEKHEIIEGKNLIVTYDDENGGIDTQEIYDIINKYFHIKKDNDLKSLFAGVTNENELQQRYKELLKIYHPDSQAGDATMTQMIQESYNKLLNSGEFI